MMPFNMLVTVDGYWEYKFRNQSYDHVDTSAQELTKYEYCSLFGLLYGNCGYAPREQEEFETYLSIAGAVPSALAVLIHAVIGYRFSINRRSIVSLVISATF